MKIGILGTGTIASAVVDGMAPDGHHITISKRGRAHAERLAGTYDNVAIADNQGVVDQSDVLFVGLMAEQASNVLSGLTFRADQKVISLMAGLPLEDLNAMVGPASAVANMIPYLAVSAGGSPILVLGDTAIIQALFGARNSIFEMSSQGELSAYLAAQAVLSPATYLVQQAGAWLASRAESAEQGEAFLRVLVGSSLLATPDCTELLQKLNTPGGYNQRLRQHMENGGLAEQLSKGLSALQAP